MLDLGQDRYRPSKACFQDASGSQPVSLDTADILRHNTVIGAKASKCTILRGILFLVIDLSRALLQLVLGGGALVLAAIFLITSFGDFGGPSPRPQTRQQQVRSGCESCACTSLCLKL